MLPPTRCHELPSSDLSVLPDCMGASLLPQGLCTSCLLCQGGPVLPQVFPSGPDLQGTFHHLTVYVLFIMVSIICLPHWSKNSKTRDSPDLNW